MKLGLIIGALIGLAVATILIVHFGWRQVVDAALAVGWQGLAALIGIYLVCLLLCAAGWRLLILDAPRHAILICVWARWLRESIGNLALIPTAGEIAGARELSLHGVRSGMAGASTVVDLTLELLSQIVFTLFGLALLITWYRG
ncbi:MAG: lysylphosphatidylglycerol synthase domain-containing protein, partial [Terriglobia bacterium]